VTNVSVLTPQPLPKKGSLDNPTFFEWIENGPDRVIALFCLSKAVNYTVSFVRDKAFKQHPVWEATFEPTPETMKHWDIPLHKIYSIIRQESLKDVLIIFSTVMAALKEFVMMRPDALLHIIGEEESRKKLYPRMLKVKLETAIAGFKHWSEWAGDEWLVPRHTSRRELEQLGRRV